MCSVTNADVLEVLDFVKEIGAIGYQPKKKATFKRGVTLLSERARWLLTFSCWFCLFNSRFVAIDASLYYALPATEGGTATFIDFLSVVHHYDRKRVTTRREKVLAEFLLKCSPQQREFYLDLMSKKLIRKLPVTEVQLCLDMDRVDIDVVYGPLPVLATSFSDLEYPVLVQALKPATNPENLRYAVFAKEPRRIHLFRGEDLEAHHVPDRVRKDLLVTPAPRATLVGFEEGKAFYPADVFPSLKEFKGWHESGDPGKLEDRVGGLQPLEQVILSAISNAPKVLVEKEQDLGAGLNQVLPVPNGATLLLSDAQTFLTGEAYTVDCRITEGRIEELWVEDGKPLGLRVWCNGTVRDCSYQFMGPEQSVLAAPDMVINQLLSFYYFEFGKKLVLIGREILWDSDGWRSNRLRGQGLHVEKCGLCGSTRRPHQNRGLCSGCVWNLPYYFKKYGPDVWIPPSRLQEQKRYAGCWNYTLLNILNYRHAGKYILKARENGDWMFATEDQSLLA